jgi:hypothetical protein
MNEKQQIETASNGGEASGFFEDWGRGDQPFSLIKIIII